MKTEDEMVYTESVKATELKICPSCGATVNAINRRCPYCSYTLYIRICPFCQSAIASDEDPCHVCGHLEPTIMETKTDKPDTGVRLYYWYRILFFLVFGVIMVIWPEANPRPGEQCTSVDIEDCFIPWIIWGRTGGSVFILIGLFFLGWHLIAKLKLTRIKRNFPSLSRDQNGSRST